MFLIAQALSMIINIVIFVIFAQIVIYWLVMFDVLKVTKPQARHLVDSLNGFANKLYGPIRRVVPLIGGIDISPVIVIVGLQLLNSLVWRVFV